MSKSTTSIKNAAEIIERFGGIRPMSSKTDIPVTTIQGWKKRDAIPAKRAADIQKAAAAHDVDLGSLMKSGGANENAQAREKTQKDAQEKPKSHANVVEEVPVKTERVDTNTADHNNDDAIILDQKSDQQSSEMHNAVQNKQEYTSIDAADLEEKLAQMETKAVMKSAIICLVIIVIAVGITAAMLWPSAKEFKEQVNQNETAIADIQQDGPSGINTSMGDLLPQSWRDQISNVTTQAQELKDQAAELKGQADAALAKAQEISTDVLGKDSGSLEQRVAKLEAHLGEAMETPQMTYFMDQLQGIGASVPGQDTLSDAQTQLSDLMSAYTGAPEQLQPYLNQAREQSAALGQTFENVPADDMKAAALLFSLNQVRGALSRDGKPFADDLELMQNLLGFEDPDLNAAIAKLSPSAESGVLTIGGLTEEFQQLAGDVVESSIKGEDVSVQEKAKARLNNMFSVERDGELVTGTDTQATIVRINKLLEAGDVETAITEAKTLSGPEAQVVAPWIAKAEETKAATELKNFADANIDLRTMDQQNAADGVSVESMMPKGGRMITDPKSGLQIYLPSKNVMAGSKAP